MVNQFWYFQRHVPWMDMEGVRSAPTDTVGDATDGRHRSMRNASFGTMGPRTCRFIMRFFAVAAARTHHHHPLSAGCGQRKEVKEPHAE